MKQTEYIKLLNKGIIKKEHCIKRGDERIEWQCEHGVGHTIVGEGMHGCDGCCSKLKEKK